MPSGRARDALLALAALALVVRFAAVQWPRHEHGAAAKAVAFIRDGFPYERLREEGSANQPGRYYRFAKACDPLLPPGSVAAIQKPWDLQRCMRYYLWLPAENPRLFYNHVDFRPGQGRELLDELDRLRATAVVIFEAEALGGEGHIVFDGRFFEPRPIEPGGKRGVYLVRPKEARPP
jgi:hypothetical protein